MPLALVFDGERYHLRFGLWHSLVITARAEKLQIWKLWNGIAGLASRFLRRVLDLWIQEYSKTGNGRLCDQAQ